MLNFLQDFVCGSISGVASCFSGYFLDTLKVRMQVNPGAKMLATFKAIINNEGFKSLYKGIYYPLMTVPLVNAIIFSSY
jgi:solute carrier family 25 carnitine/acylcarnitine transporter 20/29